MTVVKMVLGYLGYRGWAVNKSGELPPSVPQDPRGQNDDLRYRPTVKQNVVVKTFLNVKKVGYLCNEQ